MTKSLNSTLFEHLFAVFMVLFSVAVYFRAWDTWDTGYYFEAVCMATIATIILIVGIGMWRQARLWRKQP